MMNRCVMFLVVALGLSGWAQAFGASLKMPLRALTDIPEMRLVCVTDQKTVQIPVPERWAVRRMSLKLRMTVSNNVVQENSQLVIRLNDVVVTQMRLGSRTQDATVDVPILPDLVVPGYNRLAFESIQHTVAAGKGNQCESPCSPDLWTVVDLVNSFVQVDYDLAPIPLDLSKLADYVFDPRLMPEAHVRIVTEDLSEAAINSAALIASGVARRFDYRKVTFSTSRELDPEADNIIVGKLAYVTKALGRVGADLPKGKGGILKLLHAPGAGGRPDATRVLLVVTGETDEAVRIAAMTFSSISLPFPGSDEMQAFQFVVPDLQQYSGREVLSTGKNYTLKMLNYDTHTFRGINASPRRVTFRLPVDFQIRPNQYADVKLNFTYGSGLKQGSALGVVVNGQGARAISLPDPAGTFVDGYKIRIPTYLFKPGANVLEFAPTLLLPGQVCDLIQTEGLFVTVYDNSTLEFPSMPHLVEMPRLDLFAFNGFPITRWPDGHDATVLLAERDDRVLSSALNVVGQITQRNGFPLFALKLSYAQRAAGDIVLVGALAKLPEAIRKAAPLSTDGALSKVPYPVVQSWAGEISLAYSSQTGGLGAKQGLLMQMQSPFEQGRSVTVLAARDNNDLYAVSRAMLDPTVSGQTKGDLTLVDLSKSEPRVVALDSGKHYMTGKAGAAMVVESLLYTRPLVHYGVIGGALVLLTAIVYVVVRRRRVQRGG